MKRARCLIVVSLALASCSTEAPTVQTAKLADTEFAVPLDWQSVNQSERERDTVTWSEPRTAHASKAAVTVVRVKPPGIGRKHGTTAGQLSQLLTTAQLSLIGGKFEFPMVIRSNDGLEGMMVAGEFAPATSNERYQRMHAVLVADEGLVHVLYTAPVGTPSEAQAVFQQALQSMHVTGKGQ
jgi:hypothetical protein